MNETTSIWSTSLTASWSALEHPVSFECSPENSNHSAPLPPIETLGIVPFSASTFADQHSPPTSTEDGLLPVPQVKTEPELMPIASKPKVTATTSPTYQCSVCSRPFSHRFSYSRHKRIHIGKPFGCQHCYRAFCREDELRRHRVRCSILKGKGGDC